MNAPSIVLHTLVVIGIASVLGGCATYTQTTSGKSYLAKYGRDTPMHVANPIHRSLSSDDESGADAKAYGLDVEGAIREAARVEPQLQFPARIGIARIGSYGLTAIPEVEARAWFDAAKSLGPTFGEFVPVSPLIANMVTASLNVEQDSGIHDVVNQIRLAAARQHLDAVLMYEVLVHSQTGANALAFTDVTLVGAFVLPTRDVDAVGTAQGVLIDVLQGYPYGTIQTTVEDHELSSAWAGDDQARELASRVRTRAAAKLAGESSEMFKRLRWELAERD